MLITKELMSKLKKYFIQYSKYAVFVENNRQDFAFADELEEKMCRLIEKIIAYYAKRDEEKSRFIEECIIGQKSWRLAYDELHIEYRTYYTWKQEILSDMVIGAVVKGLITLDIDLDIG